MASLINRRQFAVNFTDAVYAAVGESLLGAVLFGSVARGTDTATSDVDVLFVLPESQAESTADSITRLARQASRQYRIAVSSDTVDRLQHFVDVGDPFVRTIFGQGEILRDTNGLLSALHARCHDPNGLPDVKDAAQYLHAKALFHHRRVYEQLYELLGDLQLSLMARFQALSLLANSEPTPDSFFRVSTWDGAKASLGDGVLDEESCAVAQLLIEAHKKASEVQLFSEFRQCFSTVAEKLELAYIDRMAASHCEAPPSRMTD